MNPKLKIFFFIGILLLSGCSRKIVKDNNLSNNLQSETRIISGFNEIKAGNTLNLEISVQKDYSLVVETNESLLPQVTTEVKGETLVISTQAVKSSQSRINVKISLPELKKIEIWGASSAVVTNLKSDTLEILASGTSSLTIDGETKTLIASAIGASTIDAQDLKTEKAEAQTTGSSNMTIYVANDLTAEALGASSIFYLGGPKTIKQNIIGTSVIQKK